MLKYTQGKACSEKCYNNPLNLQANYAIWEESKLKKTVIVATALAALICAMPVWSQGPGQAGPGAGGQRGMGPLGGQMQPMQSNLAITVRPPQMNVLNQLPLTTEQTTLLQTYRTNNESAAAVRAKNAADSLKLLRDALLAPKYDEASVKILLDKANTAEDEITKANIAEWTYLRSLLTADQAAKLQTIINQPRPSRGGAGAGAGAGGRMGGGARGGQGGFGGGQGGRGQNNPQEMPPPPDEPLEY